MPGRQRGPGRRQKGDWITIGWQGITLRVPDDWYPAALGTDRASGYLRVQSADGPAAEVKWFSPRGTVDMEKELAKYRRTLERAARKRHETVEWRPKPKLAVREAKPDKNRRFFGWAGDAQALGVIWYCRTCQRVVIAQVSVPQGQDGNALASAILSSIEDHGEDGRDLWSLYGLQALIPEGWSLDKHQLMAGYTMLQFRQRDRVLRTERWALANLALKEGSLIDFIWTKSRKFWKDFRVDGDESEWRDHPAVEFRGRSRKLWMVAAGPVLRLLRRPMADRLSARAWHCGVGNKIFAVHAIHARGQDELFEQTVESVFCHGEGS